MRSLRSIAVVALSLSCTFTLAAPTNAVPHQRIARSRSQLSQGQVALTQAVEFQTVTNTETRVGTITETCTVKLTPVQANGQDVVQQDKSCVFVVTPIGGTPPSNNNNLNNNNQNNNQDQNQNQNSDNNVTSTSSQEGTPPISDIGFSTIAATATETTAESSATAPPAISEIGVSSIDAASSNNIVQTGAVPAISEIGVSSVAATESTPTQVQISLTGALTTLGTLTPTSLSTTPSAAAAQESAPAAAQVPGRKLEVLPIGLGVFAGISVIALIVVGLVTYERTKYRKAFRQRKLAEAGANMGYGGMAERT